MATHRALTGYLLLIFGLLVPHNDDYMRGIESKKNPDEEAVLAAVGHRHGFIFDSRDISWAELLAYSTKSFNDTIRKDVLGSFPVAHAYSGTDIAGVQWDEELIRFPAYGAYYLKTSIGDFKLLLLDPALDEPAKIVEIASFVVGNIVHSSVDAGSLRPWLGRPSTPQRLLPTLFGSDQPLKLHCGGASEILAYVLFRQGYRPQMIQLLDDQGRNVHVVMQVFIPSLGKYVMVDPDYGAVVRDGSGLLSIQEIALALRKDVDTLLVEDIGNGKKAVLAQYNQPHTDQFTWTPSSNSEIPMLDELEYLRDMTRYTSQYSVYEWGGKDWYARREFNWDGTPIWYVESSLNRGPQVQKDN